MKSSYLPLFLLSILFLIGCGSDEVEEVIEGEVISSEQQELIDAVNAEAFSLNEKPLEIRDTELTFLDEISNARLIGLGEATHGTKEFFQMKHRIFQYLVENHGYKAFVFEMDMAEAMIFNDWVQHRTDGDITALMREKMIFWTWRTAEVRTLLEWMRTYNNGKTEEEMIGFYGVDTQATIYNRDALVDIISKVDTEVANEISVRTSDYMRMYELYSENYSDVTAIGIRESISFAKTEVELLVPKIEAALGIKEAMWALQLVRNMEQVETVIWGGERNNRYFQRDLFMAENTSWLFNLLGDDTKMVLWAHNAHVANDSGYTIWGGSQGKYLKETYQDDYQIIGFTFSTGSFTAVEFNGPLRSHTILEAPRQGSVNWLFSKADPVHFAIKTDPKNSTLNFWFQFSKSMMMIGSGFNGNSDDFYREVPIQSHYNYLIHMDQTNNSELL